MRWCCCRAAPAAGFARSRRTEQGSSGASRARAPRSGSPGSAVKRPGRGTVLVEAGSTLDAEHGPGCGDRARGQRAPSAGSPRTGATASGDGGDHRPGASAFAHRAGGARPRAARAGAADRRAGRGSVRPPELQPGDHHRRRAGAGPDSATPPRAMAAPDWKRDGARRPIPRRCSSAARPACPAAVLPVLLGVPPPRPRRWRAASRVPGASASTGYTASSLERTGSARAGLPSASPSGPSQRPRDAARDPAAIAQGAGCRRSRPFWTTSARPDGCGGWTGWWRSPGSRPGSRAARPRSTGSSSSWSRPALTPPSVPELERQTGRRDVAAILRLAAATGRVEAGGARPLLRPGSARPVRRRPLQEVGRGPDIVPSELRQRLGISRKYLIPLLEWADPKGVTVGGGVGECGRLQPRLTLRSGVPPSSDIRSCQSASVISEVPTVRHQV